MYSSNIFFQKNDVMQLQRKKYILMPPALTFLMSKFIH